MLLIEVTNFIKIVHYGERPHEPYMVVHKTGNLNRNAYLWHFLNTRQKAPSAYIKKI